MCVWFCPSVSLSSPPLAVLVPRDAAGISAHEAGRVILVPAREGVGVSSRTGEMDRRTDGQTDGQAQRHILAHGRNHALLVLGGAPRLPALGIT